MSSFEVVDFIPGYERKSKHATLFGELVSQLEKLRNGSSLRKEMPDPQAAKAIVYAARLFFKKNELEKHYFSTGASVADESGKFYAYFGRRKTSKN